MTVQGIICQSCGLAAPRRGAMQKYCEPCSSTKNAERQRKWARENPLPREVAQAKDEARRSQTVQNGIDISEREALPILWGPSQNPWLEWQVRIAIPFQWAVSKNSIYTLRPGGHVALRREAKAYREEIGRRVKQALGDRKLANNKLWLDILVQKPNHKGDAVNVVDSVCDGLKAAIGLDDRWYSIYRLDWQIVKSNPQIYVGIGQTTTQDISVCSSCGRLLPLDKFPRSKRSPLGVGRECRECRSCATARAA